jgi:hypothetical protein
MKTIKLTSVLVALLLISNVLFAQTKPFKGSFLNCWTTKFERCVEPDGVQNFTVVQLSKSQLMGYYQAGGGYLIGTLSAGGSVWSGKWYSSNCGNALCEGTFRFELIAPNKFKGRYDTKKGCPNLASYCPDKKKSFYWNGEKTE